MPSVVDSLQVKIEANADKAFKAVEQLISRLNEFNRMSGKSVGALINLNDRLKELQTNTSKIKAIRNPLRNFNEGARQTRDTVSDAVEPTRKLSDNMNRLSRFASTAGGALKTIATGGFALLGKAVQGTVGRLQRFMRSITRIAMYRAIRSALRAITQGFSQGIENLYLWSQVYNTTFAPTMDRFASTMLYLRNGFASMWSPLIEYFMPYLELLVDKLVDAFNWVQRLFAQLTGRETWNKAVKVQTQYKESTQGTAEAVKELRQEIQLMDFDEINNLTDNADNGRGGKAADALNPNPADMFTLEKTLNPMKGTLWENIKQKFSEWLAENGLLDENGKMDWEKVGEKVGAKIKEWIEHINWSKVWQTVKAIFIAGFEFFKGLLKGLFPELFNEEPKKNAEAGWNDLDATNLLMNGTPTQQEINDRIAYIQEQLGKVSKDTLTGEDVSTLFAQIYANRGTVGGAGLYERMFEQDKNFQAYALYMEQLEKLTAMSDEMSKVSSEGWDKVTVGFRHTNEALVKTAQAAEETTASGQTAWQRIKAGLKSIWDGFKDGSIWRGMGEGYRTFGKYASGGYVSQGTMFVAGEVPGQAEMIGNINGRTGVASGAEITGIGDAVWSTGNQTANLLAELITIVREKNLTISPSASLGKVVSRSQRLYASQTG